MAAILVGSRCSLTMKMFGLRYPAAVLEIIIDSHVRSKEFRKLTTISKVGKLTIPNKHEC